MSQVCYVCRTNSSNFLKNGRQIFSEFALLPSNNLLSDALGEILEREVTESEAHSKILCIRCANIVMEYDLFQTKLKTLKTKLQLEWTKGENMQKAVTITTTNASPVKPPTKIVLPASKLQPLPRNFMLNVHSLQNVYKLAPRFVKVSNPILKPETVTTSIDTPTDIKTNISDMSNKIITNVLKDNNTTLTKLDSLMTLDLESLPNDFMATMSKSEKNESNDMEIDECVTVVPFSTNNGTNNLKEVDIGGYEVKNGTDMVNNGNDMLNNGADMENNGADMVNDGDDNGEQYVALMNDKDESNEVIFSEFNVVDGTENEDDQPTLVLDSTNSDALIRLMVSQKLMYGDKQISFIMKQSEDAQEPDIEFRLSGDEETANAIIAAQQQGGSFIKLESGEMFEVQCVESKSEDQISKSDVITASMIQKNDDGLFTCLLCQKIVEIESEPYIANSEDMVEHLKIIHSAKLYICATCGYYVRERAEYNKHLEQHLNEPQGHAKNDTTHKFECSQCHKKFTSKNLLMDHMMLHAGRKTHYCKTCDKYFVSKYTLQAHLKTHTNRSRPYGCEICAKTFMTIQNLKQHEKTHSSIKEFVCRICDKAFGTQHSLEVHSVVHTRVKKFLCDICNKGFARKQEVVDHVRTHTGERPFTCSICGDSFAQRSNLHSHRRHTHTDERRYSCEYCAKKFKRRRLLEYHIKARHTGERPLHCDTCGASFVYPEHFKKHQLVHSGNKPYACEICGKTFNSRDNRNTHIFVHSDKKPYECVVCGLGYMRKQALYTHMHQSGHLAETIVVNHPRVENIMDKVVLETDNQTSENTTTENSTELDANEQKNDEELLAYNIDPDAMKNANLLEEGTIVSADVQNWGEDGIVKIVEIQLPDGNNGWVAINS